jgi:hypothetical protein
MVDHPFATRQIEVGETIDDHNSDMRPVPKGLLGPPGNGVAVRNIAPGSPILVEDLGEAGHALPENWWVVESPIPAHGQPGDDIMVVMVETGEVIHGVIAHPASNDTFGMTTGGVAVPPDRAGDIAVAAATGQITVLISTR